jgi:hypothetical protein
MEMWILTALMVKIPMSEKMVMSRHPTAKETLLTPVAQLAAGLVALEAVVAVVLPVLEAVTEAQVETPVPTEMAEVPVLLLKPTTRPLPSLPKRSTIREEVSTHLRRQLQLRDLKHQILNHQIFQPKQAQETQLLSLPTAAVVRPTPSQTQPQIPR